eukprot:115833-Hanusia_phi.AAC.1
MVLLLCVGICQGAISVTCGSCTFVVSDEGVLSREGDCTCSSSVLGFSSYGIKNITSGTFDGLSNLTLLYLSGNELAALPAGVFEGLSSLQELYLSNNDLTTLPAGVFDGLSSLQELWLDNNELTTLPAGVFDGLSSLYWLYLENSVTCGSCTFVVSDEGVLSREGNCTCSGRLSLSSYGIKNITSGTFDG